MNVTNWQKVKINENFEPLVRLEAEGALRVRPMYRELGYREALPYIYLREGVAKRLHKAAAALPKERNLTLIVLDGWRPVDLQAQLYFSYRENLAGIYQGSEDIEEITTRFVSMPSTELSHPSPHLTGGSVDVTLGDEFGVPLEMGAEFDELSDRARTDYYQSHTFNNRASRVAERREILVEAMRAAGFTNYSEEFFHFDYGNQWWGVITGNPAIYGKAELEAPIANPYALV